MGSSNTSFEVMGMYVFMIAMMIMAGQVAAQGPALAPTKGSDWDSIMLQLVDCLGYVMGSAAMPTATCYTNLSTIIHTTPQCLCQLNNTTFTGPPGVNLMHTMQLPPACKLTTPDPSLSVLKFTLRQRRGARGRGERGGLGNLPGPPARDCPSCCIVTCYFWDLAPRVPLLDRNQRQPIPAQIDGQLRATQVWWGVDSEGGTGNACHGLPHLFSLSSLRVNSLAAVTMVGGVQYLKLFQRQKFQPLSKISRFVHSKDVEVPLKAFCTTKEDFHREYGLSFEGKDVRKLIDTDVSMSDWLKVFTCLSVKEKKMPIKTARPDHYKALYQLYKQWAGFASEVVKNVTNEGHLDRKREQWKLSTSQVSTGTPSGSAILLVNTPSESTPVGSGLFATTQSAFSVDVSTSLQELLVEVTKSHDNVSAECQKAKDYVVKSVADVHRCEGALDTIRIHFLDDANVPTGFLDSFQEKFDQANATLQQAHVCF
ncbi:hypothetical protein L7F22_029792 [Adiantum nelumboides]|nr:hypothetical protein [Adiantum nelumboides]